VVDGRVGKLRHALPHHDIESLTRYLTKHNEYSNWEARVLSQATEPYDELPPALFGNQAQRRRWLKKRFLGLPGLPVFFFLYKYILRLGILDRARLNLLRSPINPLFPYKSENVRT
jgi:hypothetical protein